MSTPKPKAPPDPDPTPTAQAGYQSADLAANDARKTAAKNYGRRKTILTGSSEPASEARKNILG